MAAAPVSLADRRECGGKQGSATEEVMAALGYTREQVDAAIAQGAVEGSKNLKQL